MWRMSALHPFVIWFSNLSNQKWVCVESSFEPIEPSYEQAYLHGSHIETEALSCRHISLLNPLALNMTQFDSTQLHSPRVRVLKPWQISQESRNSIMKILLWSVDFTSDKKGAVCQNRKSDRTMNFTSTIRSLSLIAQRGFYMKMS